MELKLDPDQLAALTAAVSEGTFEAASRSLHVTPSAISQRIKALEIGTGRVLLRRGKPIQPTESGVVLLRAARQIEMIGAEATRQLGAGSGATPRVGIAVNADSLATWIMPALAALGSEVSFEVSREDEMRTAALLRDGSVLAAVTSSKEPVPGCTVMPLGAMRYRACAAPAFIKRWLPAGATAEELASAPVVDFDSNDQLQNRYLRRRCRRTVEPPRHRIPGSGAVLHAIACGLGWGMIPDPQSREPLRAGVLVSFDDEHPVDVWLYWQQWRLHSDTLDRVAVAVRTAASAALV